MEYRLLGRSGLKVSTISLGTATFGGDGLWGDTDLAAAERQIDMYLDAGVNLIDTANVYSKGVSEEITGAALARNGRRARALIATKVRFRAGPGPNDVGLSRQSIVAQAEASLRRLKTDVIDLYQVHEWDGQTPLEETLEALDTLVKQGKVRYIGCSNYSGWHLMKALAVSDRHNYQRFVSQQIHYTLEAREAEYELQPISIDQGLGILVWSPLGGGWLSGKYTRSSKPDSGRHVTGFKEPPIYDWERLWDIVDVLNEVAKGRGVSGAVVALAWLLQRNGVTSVIAGGRTDQQLQDNLNAAELKLSEDEVKRLDEVSQKPLIYPYWHQNWTASDRLGEADMELHRPFIGK
ncbi:MAG TPA: aldo/keto reductase [Devosia sp.]|nr:aldo/keto reductase [Devosia sp.]